MSDFIIIHDFKIDEKLEQPTGVLAPNGEPIVRVPNQIGFTSSKTLTYAVKKK